MLYSINKYHEHPIRIAEGENGLATHEVNGIFDVFDTKTLLSWLQAMGIQVEDAPDGSKVLRAAK